MATSSAEGRLRGARSAIAALVLGTAASYALQLSTVPMLKDALGGRGAVTVEAIASALRPADWVSAASAAAALVALVVLQLRFGTVVRGVAAALDGSRGPRVVLYATLIAFAVRGYFDPGVPVAFDGKVHWARVDAVASLVESGHFPGWTWRFAGGMPLHRLFGPLFYWLVALVALPGVPHMLALRLVLAACHVASAWAVGLFVRRWLGSARAACAATAFALFLPQHFHSVLRLGRLPDALAFVLFPLLLAAAEGVLARRGTRDTLLTAFSAAALVLTHTGVGAIGCILAAAYGLVRLVASRPGAGAAARTVGSALVAVALSAALVAFHVGPALDERPWMQLGYDGRRGAESALPGHFHLGYLAPLVTWRLTGIVPTSVFYLGLGLVGLTLYGAARLSGRRGTHALPLLCVAALALWYVASHYYGSRASAYLSVLVAAGAGAAFVERARLGPVWLLLALAELLPFSVVAPFRPGSEAIERDLATIAGALPGRRLAIFGERRGLVTGSNYQVGGASGLPVVGCPIPEEATATYPWHLALLARIEEDLRAGRGLDPETQRAMRLLGVAGVVVEDGRRLVPLSAAAAPGTGRVAGDRALVLLDAAPALFSTSLAPASGTLRDGLVTNVAPREIPAAPTDRAAWIARLDEIVEAFGVPPDAPVCRAIVVESAPDAPTAGAEPAQRAPGFRWMPADDVRFAFEVDAPADGWLLVACSSYPGVHVLVDGARHEHRKSALGQPVVRVSRGPHRIEVVGPTLPRATGWFWLSGAALGTGLLLACLRRRRAATDSPA